MSVRSISVRQKARVGHFFGGKRKNPFGNPCTTIIIRDNKLKASLLVICITCSTSIRGWLYDSNQGI